MFKNIGKKIKGLAVVLCILGILIAVVIGLLFIVIAVGLLGNQLFPTLSKGVKIGLGIISIVVGFLGSWIGSFVLYGLGQLIDNTDKLVAQKQQEEYQQALQAIQTIQQPAQTMQAVQQAPQTTVKYYYY